MKLYLCLFFSFPLLCFAGENHRISAEDTAVLDAFFRTICRDEGGGYVLLGQKPVSTSGFLERDSCIPATNCHKNSVTIKEGVRVWKNLNLIGKNFILNCSINDNVSGYKELHVINQTTFLKTIQNNLSLFQYILGPKVKPQTLLAAFLSGGDLSSVLKDDKVLIGIILGYGTQNAIRNSRNEHIRNAIIDFPDIPPFQSKLMQSPQLSNNEKDYFFFSPSRVPSRQAIIQPSFGFSSLDEEFSAIEESMDVSPFSLRQEPVFIFGYIKGDVNSHVLIKELEETQIKLRLLLQSSTFLLDVLKIITEKDFTIETSKTNGLEINSSDIPINFIIAKNIWNQINTIDQEYLKEFLVGFRNRNAQEDIRCGFFPENYKTTLDKARGNIQNSLAFFDNLDRNSEFTPILQNKLYYKVLTIGKGKELVYSDSVKLNYEIKDPKDCCLVTEFEKIIKPTETIPGFAHGIKGMRIGETRRIYIDSSLAYGLCTLLEKGMYLDAKVTLLDMSNTQSVDYPKLLPLDLSFIFDPEFEQKASEENRQLANFEGARVSEHYSKSNLIDIEKVYLHLKEMQNSDIPLEISVKESEIINKLHWNIYYSS